MLEQAIQEYGEAKTMLEAAIKEYGEAMVISHNVDPSEPQPPEIEGISDRFFEARDALEEVCKSSDESLAQRYAETAALAHECSSLQLADSVENHDECVKRMKDYKNAELALLGF